MLSTEYRTSFESQDFRAYYFKLPFTDQETRLHQRHLTNHQVKPFYSGSKCRATVVTNPAISIPLFCRPTCIECTVSRGLISDQETVAHVLLRSRSGFSLQNSRT